MLPTALIIFIIFMVICGLALIALLIKICNNNCKPNDGRRRRTNPQWNRYDHYQRNNTFTGNNEYITNNDYITNHQMYHIRGIEMPMNGDFNVTHIVSHHTETPVGGGLAGDIGSGFSDMFSSSGGDTGGGCDSGGGFDSGGCDTGGGGDTGGCDTGGGDTGCSSYD